MTTDEAIKFISDHDFSITLELDKDGATGDLQDNENSLYVLECGKPKKLATILKEMVAKVKGTEESMMTTQSKLITLITDGYRVEFQLVKSHFFMVATIADENYTITYADTIKPTFGEAVSDIFRQIKGVT